MATKWTTEQQQVISLRDRDILVSAAAGSGKTAVLVERIIEKVCDKEHPVDIDHILVVTFTNAAAAEMRERIRMAIEKAAEEDSSNAHLLRQLTLVHNAQITTIHSFCLYVIRNHFHEIGLDPDFRLGDEGEMTLLKSKVLDQVMEEHYNNAEESFTNLVSTYSRGGKDTEIVEMIEQMYRFAISYPWPMQWLKQSYFAYEIEDVKQLKSSEWMQEMVADTLESIKDYKKKTEDLIEIASSADGPGCYLKSLRADLEIYDDFLAEGDYEEIQKLFAKLKYPMIGNSRGYTGDPEVLEYVKEERNNLKTVMTKLGKEYYVQTIDEILEKLQMIRPHTMELAKLTEEYLEAFSQAKRDKNLLDFSDLEHFALEIFLDEETGEPKEAALEFANYFDEIMIDEYQDSNYIQETLLRSISKEKQGKHNLFMVGDVKQSIYRFRLARPEIFMGKYDTYSTEDCVQQRIDLHMNFRSRREVLDFTNMIFYQIMNKDLGNVMYDDVAALYVGAQGFEEVPEVYETEVIIGNATNELLEENEIEDKMSYEAMMMAHRIHDLKKSFQVTDKETGTLRPVRFSDMVILLRSPGASGESIVSILTEQGIPAHMASMTGYFNTMEVETVLNLLRVLDNPFQDIPLAAVLHSTMFHFTNDEMALMRSEFSGDSFAKAVFEYNRKHPENVKLQSFIQFIEEMRILSKDTPIHEVIEIALDKTGFLEYVTALPAGANRKANVEKMIDQAIAYERSSYQGLFHFVNYIAKLQKYEVDFGSAELISENDDAVRIMSIHKSKGLEFPVVFVGGMGKLLNQQDSRGRMVLHPEYGIGLEYINENRRVKSSTFFKKVVEHKIAMENLGEELRVLYVAMTRAKEKLILTGTAKDANAYLENYRKQVKKDVQGCLPYTIRSKARTYFDWVIPAMVACGKIDKISVVSEEAVVEQELVNEIEKKTRQDVLGELTSFSDETTMEHIEEQLNYQYPFAREDNYKSKYSVSEIKHKAMEEAYKDEQAQPVFARGKNEKHIPKFISDVDESNQGALRGTAVHRFLECFDFARIARLDSKENQADERMKLECQNQLNAMIESKKITKEQSDLLLVNKLCHFLLSDTAMRMARADANQQFYVEKPFVLGMSAEELFGEETDSSEDLLLVQGIIDVFWEEEDGIVLLDYKTDKVAQSEELLKRYRQQLMLYSKAIERTTKKQVKEILIYSFALEETIEVS